MTTICDIDTFIEKMKNPVSVVLDARSPGEFAQGHIPGAINFPLLNDDERKQVGITYKSQGQQAAVVKGFELVGNQFSQFAKEAIHLAKDKEILIYCWRGGLRSNVMAWVLRLAGLNVTLLKGGYKSYRQKCHHLFSAPHDLIIIAGKTGSGKSELLVELEKTGAAVIDLENLAHHKGSSFGALGQEPQPTQEQFENIVGWKLIHLAGEKIWLEDESRLIGRMRIPDALFNQMLASKIIEVERTKEDRCIRILGEYGHFPTEQLAERTRAITKRMGGDRVKESLTSLENGDMMGWLLPLIDYYDRTYGHIRVAGHIKLLGRIHISEKSLTEICFELKEMAKQEI